MNRGEWLIFRAEDPGGKYVPKAKVVAPPDKDVSESPRGGSLGWDAAFSATPPMSGESGVDEKERRYGPDRTTLMLACDAGDREGVLRLMAGGADIEAKDGYDQTPLMLATRAGHADIVGDLLIREAEIECRDASGNTPLLVASAAGKTGIVKLLLDSDADIDARNMVAMTSLMLAAQTGNSRGGGDPARSRGKTGCRG